MRACARISAVALLVYSLGLQLRHNQHIVCADYVANIRHPAVAPFYAVTIYNHLSPEKIRAPVPSKEDAKKGRWYTKQPHKINRWYTTEAVKRKSKLDKITTNKALSLITKTRHKTFKSSLEC